MSEIWKCGNCGKEIALTMESNPPKGVCSCGWITAKNGHGYWSDWKKRELEQVYLGPSGKYRCVNCGEIVDNYDGNIVTCKCKGKGVKTERLDPKSNYPQKSNGEPIYSNDIIEEEKKMMLITECPMCGMELTQDGDDLICIDVKCGYVYNIKDKYYFRRGYTGRVYDKDKEEVPKEKIKEMSKLTVDISVDCAKTDTFEDRLKDGLRQSTKDLIGERITEKTIAVLKTRVNSLLNSLNIDVGEHIKSIVNISAEDPRQISIGYQAKDALGEAIMKWWASNKS